MEPSLAGGRRSCHQQQNQPKYRDKAYSNGTAAAALFLQFPPPPNYPPSHDRISFDGKVDKKMHRCPNDLDRIEICLEPEQMVSSSPTAAEPYDRRGVGVGGGRNNGIGKFHNNVELQVSYLCVEYVYGMADVSSCRFWVNFIEFLVMQWNSLCFVRVY